uniref:Ig-like domain-containing protein n=1 Tax=Roseateles sp. TaxID=1971397 RepID=UPI00286D2602
MKMPICWAVSLAAVVVARPARVKVMAAALSALLVACGGGGGGGGAGSEPPPAPVDTKPSVAPNYFPIVTGHRWIYSESANASAASTMVTVGGALTVDGQTGTVLRTLEAGETKATESLLLPSTSALHEIPLAGSDAFSLAVGKIQLLRLPVRAGDTFVQLDKILDKDVDLDGDGRADRLVIRAEVTVLGFENVQTPAGDFSACLHQRAVLKSSVTLSSDGRVIPIETTMDEWFAPDIGLVRRVQQESSGGRTESSTTTLSQFRLGDRRSESVPPTVLSSTPEATTAGQQSLWVKVVFSEPVDPDSMQQAFSVVDSKGQAVQGTVQVAGATAQFVPVQSWPSGRYTARIGTEAQDLLGNPLASVRTWSFDVDATAPAVVGTTPLEGAQDVDVGKPILIQFSEPVDAKTVNANTVWITDNYNPTPALLSVNGSTV